jgi:hypothetical protein
MGQTGRPALGLDVADPGQQEREGGVGGRGQRRVVAVEQVALPPHREVVRVGEGEAGVGLPGRPEPLAGGRVRAGVAGGLGDGRPQQLEALGGDGGEQGRLVGAVVGRGGMEHPEPTDQRAQAHRLGPRSGVGGGR